MILATCLYFSYHFKLTQKKLLCLCDGIGRHARLKTLSIMGPGSSPGAGNILNFLLKWLTALFTVLFFPQKLYNHMSMVLLDYTTQFTPCLETVYSSWVLHVLFIYLSLLLAFRFIIRFATN